MYMYVIYITNWKLKICLYRKSWAQRLERNPDPPLLL